jgi:ADP-heptose:LPS heptosyltransferase
MSEICIKGASGLGDNIYLYPIVKHFASLYDKVYIMSDYPELFESLPNVTCSKHLKLNFIPIADGKTVRKKEIDLRCTYGPRKHKIGTDQFQDTYIFARTQGHQIPDLKLELPWELKNTELVNTVRMIANKNAFRKIAVVAAPYQPFGRTDKWGSEITIDPEVIQYICDDLKELGYLVITIGNDFCLYEPMVEYNMIGQTTVPDMLDLVKMADLTVTQIGNLLPISEALNTKNITIFSKNIPNCEHKFLRAITPDKCVHRKDINLSMYDNEPVEKIREFCR